MPIHPTAILGPQCEIDPSADVGAYAIVEPGVRIGPQTRVYPHAYISQGTTIGARCAIHPFAVVGHHPQDLKWDRSPSYTRIGDDCVIREGAQIHRGTAPQSTTTLGNRVYVMATAHVGHNCDVGDDVILANAAMLSGYAQIGARTFISGCALLHQFVRVGTLVMISGGTRVPMDIPPYMTTGPLGIHGPNVVGLRRAGFTPEQRTELRTAYKLLYRSGIPFREAVERVADMVRTEPGRTLVEFLQAPSKRGIRGWHGRGGATEEE